MGRERERTDQPPPSRREFGRRLALGTAAALAAPAGACRGGGHPATVDRGPGAPVRDAAAPPLGSGAVDPRLARILARHGATLSAAQRKELVRLLKGADETSAALRKFALGVGDEPALVLRPRPVRRDAR